MKYLVIILFVFSSLNVLAQDSFSYYEKSTTSYPKVTQIESQLFQRSFDDDIYSRLNRIEQRLYHQNFPQSSLADRIDRISSVINKNNLSDVYLGALSNLERQVFSRIDTRNDIETRVSNLEISLIGAIQTGDYEDRIGQLKMVAENTCTTNFSLGGMSTSSTYYDENQPNSPYYNSSPYSQTASPRGILQDLITIFTGFLGRGYNNNYGYNNGFGNGFFSPNYYNSAYPSNYSTPYNSNYNGNYNGFNQPTITTQNQYFDSSMGVKILD